MINLKTYILFTSPCTGPSLNPGSNLITDGIKALIRFHDPEAVFLEMSLFNHVPLNWDVINARADAIFLCGNPRFELSNNHFYWLTDLLKHMLSAQGRGVKIGDLFLGTAHPLPLSDNEAMANSLLKFSRNRETLSLLSGFDMVITRDALSQCLCEGVVKNSCQLPDSTFWARYFWDVAPEGKKYNCVTFPRLHCTDWLLKQLYKIASMLAVERTTYFLCTCWEEYRIALSVLSNPQNILLIYDPESLLRFYSRVDKLVSCRLHSSIPALSLGAQVVNIAMDSRSQAFDAFDFKSIPFLALKDRLELGKFNFITDGVPPGHVPFTDRFKECIL